MKIIEHKTRESAAQAAAEEPGAARHCWCSGDVRLVWLPGSRVPIIGRKPSRQDEASGDEEG